MRSAAIVTHVPYSDGGGVSTSIFSIEGRPEQQRGEPRDAIIQTVAPNFLPMLNIRLRDGRLLTVSDATDSPRVALISESLAKRFFPGEDPLGKHILIGSPYLLNGARDLYSEHSWMTIVGVVDDLHYSWIVKEDIPTIYKPYRQSPPYYTTVVLRTEGDPMQMISATRAQIASVDPQLALYNIKPMDRLITESIVGIAYVAAMMAVLGAIALILASVGIFGVMSYSVSERAHEIGVRTSLGAQKGDILRMVLQSGMFLTIAGMAIGLPVALGLAYALSSLLFGVRVGDPVAFVGLPLLLAVVAMLACYLPARRAVRLDPIAALRHE